MSKADEMFEIKIGEYVRTTDGYIGKLVEIIPNVLNNLVIDVKREIIHCDNSIDNFIYTRDGFIVKHSEQLVDLIEVGDYVNSSKVVNKNRDLRELVLREDTGFLYINKGNNISKIKSIVTKQQFEEMEYKVDE